MHRRTQIAKGRVEAIRMLRDKLLAQADAAFPDAMAAYREAAGAGALPPAAAAAAAAPKAG